MATNASERVRAIALMASATVRNGEGQAWRVDL